MENHQSVSLLMLHTSLLFLIQYDVWFMKYKLSGLQWMVRRQQISVTEKSILYIHQWGCYFLQHVHGFLQALFRWMGELHKFLQQMCCVSESPYNGPTGNKECLLFPCRSLWGYGGPDWAELLPRLEMLNLVLKYKSSHLQDCRLHPCINTYFVKMFFK